MSKENIEGLRKEFKKELKKLEETLKKQSEEEKKDRVIYKTYYIERGSYKKGNENV